MVWSIKIFVAYTLFVGLVSFVVACVKAKTPAQMGRWWAVGFLGAMVIISVVKMATTWAALGDLPGWTS